MENATAVYGRPTEDAQCGMERTVTGMAEYIEKEALCTWCLETGPSYCDQCVMSRDGIPAADVRENVRAEWVNREVFTAKGHVDMLQSAFCPNCKRYHTTPYSYYFTDYAFCPNCGAKMEAQDG